MYVDWNKKILVSCMLLSCADVLEKTQRILACHFTG